MLSSISSALSLNNLFSVIENQDNAMVCAKNYKRVKLGFLFYSFNGSMKRFHIDDILGNSEKNKEISGHET